MNLPPAAFAVAAGLCWGIGEVCAKAVLHTGKIGPFAAVAIRTSLALPLIWIAFWIAHKAAPQRAGLTPSNLTPKEWLLLLGGSGVVAGALAMIAFYISISLGEVSKMKPIAFSVAPASAVLLGAFFLGEALTPKKLLAVALILLGVVLLSTNAKPKQSPSPPEPSKSSDSQPQSN